MSEGKAGSAGTWLVSAALLLTACVGEAGEGPSGTSVDIEEQSDLPPANEQDPPDATQESNEVEESTNREVEEPPSSEDAAAPSAQEEPPGLGALTCADLRTALSEALPLHDYQAQEMIAELGGPSYRAGCSFESSTWRLAVEVHAATPDQHTLIWGLASPPTEAAREQERIDGIGDEAYLRASPDGEGVVTARKGLVEVLLTHRRQGENAVNPSFTPDQLLPAAASVVEPWPSGLGAQPSAPEGVPIDVLPPDVTPADVGYFDPDDPQFEGAYDDSPDVQEFYSLSAPGDAADYCSMLRSRGYADDPSPEPGETEYGVTCIVMDSEWRIIVIGHDTTFDAAIRPR